MPRPAVQNNREELNKLPEIFVNAAIDVTYKGQTQTVVPKLRLANGGTYALPAAIPGPNGHPVVLKLEPPQESQTEPAREITLRTLNADDPTETVLVDISTKPMIGLVWLGALLYTAGGLIAYRRRAMETGIMGGAVTSVLDLHPANVGGTAVKSVAAKVGKRARTTAAKG